MDNDLMARRLRPPSQPSQNGQSQPPQPPSPWDVPLTQDGSFAPASPPVPQSDPPFAPPDPAARADVPWDRPAPEAWPPSEDQGTDYPQTWSATGGTPPAPARQPEWPAADAHGDATPWDRPAGDQSLDPDDALAPVVGDVNTSAGVWHEWSANGNGKHVAASGGNGIRYAPPNTPEPMTVAAHSDQPRSGDEPRPDAWVDAQVPSGNGPSLPEWPAEDDLTPPSSNRGPVMPEDSWPATAQDATPPPAPPADPAPWPPAQAVESDQAPEDAPPAPAQPVAPAPTVTPVVTSAQIVPAPAGSPQNMVLRIELAIVDESHRANPAETARRVGPDADVRAPEYNPRTHGGRAPMPEPEYEWGAPPSPRDQRLPAGQGRRGQQPPQPRHAAPSPSAWQPAPTHPNQLDWDLPQVGGPQVDRPRPDQPAPWVTPQQHHSQMPPPAAPPPTWAMTDPTPPYTPEPPQYIAPPSAPQYQPQYGQWQQPAQPQWQQPAPQPAWPPSRTPDPLYGVPAAPNQQAQAYQPTPNQYPTHYPAPAVQSVPSAPAAGTRARNGQDHAAADQADLWFLSSQPTAASAEDVDAQPMGKSSSLLTAGLTVGFALLVIVLVLVFIQLMTSLLK